jgi:sugar/nucleoside kinase (ribokinase family)
MVLIKLGAKGSRLICNEPVKLDVYMPAIQRFNTQIYEDHPVVDTTGAGDTFISAFVVKYTELFVNGSGGPPEPCLSDFQKGLGGGFQQ